MNELDEPLQRLGDALDDGLDAAAARAADQARALLIGAIHGESPSTAGRRRRRGRWRRRRGSPRPGGHGRWSGLLATGVAVAVTLVVLAFALRVGGNRPASSAAVPTVLPFGSSLNPSGPTGVIASSVQLAAVVPDPEGSGPAWGIKTYRVKGDMTCFQVGREQSGRIGAVGAYGSFGNDGRFHPFTFSDVGFGTCVPNDADQHAFDNVAYANAPASASGEPCPTFARGLPPGIPAQARARLTARSHAADCERPNQRLVAFGLLGPDATSVTYRTAHGTATTRTHGPDGAYLIVEPVDPAICGTQCGYSGGDAGTAMRLPIGLIATITYRDAPTCHGPPLTNDLETLQRFGHCSYIGYVAPHHPKVTEADVASPVQVQPMPARTGGASQLTVHISWIAREPVTNVNDSTYSIQITNPRRCGGGGQSGIGTQSPIRAGTRVTRDIEVPGRCAGTYRGTVVYEPSLGPSGPEGAGLPEQGAPGIYLVGRFSIVVP
jgi:hypothetical protein